MRLHLMADRMRFARMTTQELRSTFLLQDLFQPGSLQLAYTDLDRAVIGGALPEEEPIVLHTSPELRAEYFLERREIGVLNIGGKGTITTDGESFALNRLDCLYIGRGVRQVEFRSEDRSAPARFYLLSYPAHASYPTALARHSELPGTVLGSAPTCNKRTIYKAIHAEGIQSLPARDGIHSAGTRARTGTRCRLTRICVGRRSTCTLTCRMNTRG